MNELEAARWAEVRGWLEIANEDLHVARARLRLERPALGAAAFPVVEALAAAVAALASRAR